MAVAQGTARSTGRKEKPVYAVSGSDDYLRLAAIRELLDGLIEPDERDGAVAEFDGPTAELAEVLDECRTLSLLAPRRIVIVRGADKFLARKYSPARGREEAYRDAVERYLDASSPSGVLILVCDRLDARWKLSKRLAAEGAVINCEPPNMAAVPSWAMAQAAKAYNCKLDLTAARRLADLVGNSLGRLDAELAKLATFVGKRAAIGVEDVEALVGASRMENVFGIKSAIAQGNAKAALEQWDQTLATDRDAPYKAVGGLAYDFRKMVQAKQLMAGGASPNEAIKGAGLWGDWNDLTRQLDRFSLRQWQDQLLKLLRIDIGSKRGLGDVQTAVEKMIVELCSGAAAR